MRKIYRFTAVIALLGIIWAGITAKPVYAMDGSEDFATEEQTDMALEEQPEGEPEMIDAYDAPAEDSLIGEGIPTPDGMMVASTFSDSMLPLLFHKTTTTFQGASVEAAQFDNGYVLLLYITDQSGANGTFKQYNEATGEMSDFRMIAGPGESYIIVLPIDANAVVPEGFEEVILDWNGQQLSAYMNTEVKTVEGSDTSASDYLLLYAVSSNGRQGWYFYDQIEGTFQRYLNIEGKSHSSSEGGVFDFQGVKDGNSDAIIRLVIFAAMLLLVIVLIILVIILSVKLREYSEYDYIDEEDYNAINGGDYNSYENGYGSNDVNNARRQFYNEPVESDEPEEDEQDEDVEEAYYKEPETEPKTAAVMKEEPHDENAAAIRAIKERQEAERQARDRQEAEKQIRERQEIERQEAESQARDRQEAERLVRERQVSERQAIKERPIRENRPRKSLLETGDIADLDDILNDPNLTSNLPVPSEIKREMARQEQKARRERAMAEREAAARRAAEPRSYEDMQVTVDKYSAGMPAMVDTEMIAEDVRNTGNIGNVEVPEDDYYLTKRERKALEKQRRREEKEAEKDAKYLEKERRRAEKHRRYGVDSATPMDWSELGNSLREESTANDNRRPVGYDEDRLPSYMRKQNAGNVNSNSYESQPAESAQPKQRKERVISEEERANAAADAVIAAARGNEAEREEAERAYKKEQDYKQYRQNARNQYEDFKRQDEQAANASQAPQTPQTPPVPSFSQDLDEDFEFEFLNIKRPQ